MTNLHTDCKDYFKKTLFVIITSFLVHVSSTQDAMAQGAETETSKAAKIETITPFKDEAPLLAMRVGKPISALKIASIFHKKSGTEPDFRLWAKNTESYKDALEIDKKEVFTRSYNRIVKSFREIDPNEILNIQSVVQLGDYSEMQAIQIMDMFNEKTYFRYDAHGEYYAIIPHQLKKFNHLYMTPERRDEILKKTGGMTQLKVEFLLKIRDIDKAAPHELEPGRKYWLILADIAEIRLWTKSKENPKLVWRYQAEWYDGYIDAEFMNLYQGQAQ